MEHLILGASADDRGGSRAWASGTPNILNVAATRAKGSLIVVGNHDARRQFGRFRTTADLLPVIDWKQQDVQNRHHNRSNTVLNERVGADKL